MEKLLSTYNKLKETRKRPLENLDKGSEKHRYEGNDSSKAVNKPQNRILDPNEVSLLFVCNEGSVTHYYHFLFGMVVNLKLGQFSVSLFVGALIPFVEYALENKKKSFRIVTDVGPMKSILTEMPFNISEICGPALEGKLSTFNQKHTTKSAFQ